MNAPIAVVGSLNMDLVVRSPRLPQAGETIIGSDFQTLPGGKGSNQAVAAARLGGQVVMVGRVGNDTFGQALLKTLREAGVDHCCVLVDEQNRSGVALITVDDEGQNTIVVASGANMALTPEDVERAEAVIGSARVLLLQLESPLSTVQRAAEIASAHGVTVILNPAPARPIPPEILTLVDVLVPNESETTLLTGSPITDDAGAISAAAELREAGISTVILTLGARGALLSTAEYSSHLPAFPVTPVDTTAAGDAFLGGFAVALAEGQPLPDAVRWGNAAGALAATRAGAQPSLPRRQEVEALLKANGG